MKTKKKPFCKKRKLCLGFATGCEESQKSKCPLKNSFLGSCHYIAWLEDELRHFRGHARKIERESIKKWVSKAAKSSVVAGNAHIEMWIRESLRVAKEYMVEGNYREVYKR